MDNLPPVPPLPEEVWNVIAGMARNSMTTEAALVVQKKLSSMDTDGRYNRLLIPFNWIWHEFLTEEEKLYLEAGGGVSCKEVKMVEPSTAIETVKLCPLDIGRTKEGERTTSRSIYAIGGKWNDVVRRNALREGVVVQLWCFRVDGDMCFALVRLPLPHPQTQTREEKKN